MHYVISLCLIEVLSTPFKFNKFLVICSDKLWRTAEMKDPSLSNSSLANEIMGTINCFALLPLKCLITHLSANKRKTKVCKLFLWSLGGVRIVIMSLSLPLQSSWKLQSWISLYITYICAHLIMWKIVCVLLIVQNECIAKLIITAVLWNLLTCQNLTENCSWKI